MATLKIEDIKSPENNHELLSQFLNDVIAKGAVEKVNRSFAYKHLAKLSRDDEPLPTDTRQLSSYRTRLGTMLEYALSTEMQSMFEESYKDEFNLTFAVAHEYPDFYLRDKHLQKVLKIEMKAVDADSDEQAARFDVLKSEIDQYRDYIFFIGWEWKEEQLSSGELWEHPHIFTQIMLSAYEIAEERDRRLFDVGGKIENDEVLVPSTKYPGTFVKDPGNYGKFWRIVQRSRRDAEDLAGGIKKFIEFQKEIDKKAPRSRF